MAIHGPGSRRLRAHGSTRALAGGGARGRGRLRVGVLEVFQHESPVRRLSCTGTRELGSITTWTVEVSIENRGVGAECREGARGIDEHGEDEAVKADPLALLEELAEIVQQLNGSDLRDGNLSLRFCFGLLPVEKELRLMCFENESVELDEGQVLEAATNGDGIPKLGR